MENLQCRTTEYACTLLLVRSCVDVKEPEEHGKHANVALVCVRSTSLNWSDAILLV